jgi:hypothetical protein
MQPGGNNAFAFADHRIRLDTEEVLERVDRYFHLYSGSYDVRIPRYYLRAIIALFEMKVDEDIMDLAIREISTPLMMNLEETKQLFELYRNIICNSAEDCIEWIELHQFANSFDRDHRIVLYSDHKVRIMTWREYIILSFAGQQNCAIETYRFTNAHGNWLQIEDPSMTQENLDAGSRYHNPL